MSVFGLLQFAVLILAGLDRRHGWTTWISPALQVAGLIGCIVGQALVVWATASNAFFSQIVRIQTERGHTVCTRGPYAHVRHPGYTGTILASLTAPILLASGVALVLGVASAMLMLLRTALEDRTLQRELPGYVEYSQRVRHRILPGIW
jgi:protein-S-isoprenylcysteine O-methyltransferase Ste14